MTGRTNEEQARPIRTAILTQLAVWLCHESTTETGGVFEVGGGYIHRVRNELSNGLHLPGDMHMPKTLPRARVRWKTSVTPLTLSWVNLTIGKDVFGDDWSSEFRLKKVSEGCRTRSSRI